MNKKQKIYKMKVSKLKITNPLKEKTLYFRGQKYKYRAVLDLSTKLKITKEQTKKLIRDVRRGTTKRTIQQGTEIGRYDIRRRPLYLDNLE